MQNAKLIYSAKVKKINDNTATMGNYFYICSAITRLQTYFDESVLAFIPFGNLVNFKEQGKQSHSSLRIDSSIGVFCPILVDRYECGVLFICSGLTRASKR